MTLDQASPADPLAGLSRVPTQARSRAKVERALTAAQELLEREGLAALSLTRVAKEADLSVGALYQYMPDRDAIVSALTATYHQRHEARMDEMVETILSSTSTNPIVDVIDGVAEVYREQRQARVLRTELQAASDPAVTRAHKLRMVAKIALLLRSYDLVDDHGADHVARAVFFAADGAMHEAFASDADGDPSVLAELKAMLTAYLAPPTTTR